MCRLRNDDWVSVKFFPSPHFSLSSLLESCTGPNRIKKTSCHFVFMSNLILVFFVVIFCSGYFFKLDFFFQFHPSTLDWLGIKFHDFFFL